MYELETKQMRAHWKACLEKHRVHPLDFMKIKNNALILCATPSSCRAYLVTCEKGQGWNFCELCSHLTNYNLISLDM